MIRGLSIILCLLSGGLMFSQFNNSQYIKWGVTGNFHKGCIVVGIPAKIIKKDGNKILAERINE